MQHIVTMIRSSLQAFNTIAKNCCVQNALTIMIGSVFGFSLILSVVLSHMSRLPPFEPNREMHDMSLRMIESSQNSVHGMDSDDEDAIFEKPNGRNLTESDLHLVVNPKYICPARQISLVICIMSAPSNFDRRQLIRRTWGHPNITGEKVAIAFVLGIPIEDKLILDIDQESNAHGDIIIGQFTDHYENLTIKSVLAFSWATNFCNAKFLLKVDDDVLVNMFTLQRFVNSLKKHNDTANIIFCTLQRSSIPYRKGKYAVSNWEYPGKTYPAFCSGPAYFMSSEVAGSLYKSALNRPMFRLEDVYLTGFLRHELGYRITQGYQAYANKRLFDQVLRKPYLLFGHSQNNTSKFEALWASVVKS